MAGLAALVMAVGMGGCPNKSDRSNDFPYSLSNKELKKSCDKRYDDLNKWSKKYGINMDDELEKERWCVSENRSELLRQRKLLDELGFLVFCRRENKRAHNEADKYARKDLKKALESRVWCVSDKKGGPRMREFEKYSQRLGYLRANAAHDYCVESRNKLSAYLRNNHGIAGFLLSDNLMEHNCRALPKPGIYGGAPRYRIKPLYKEGERFRMIQKEYSK